MRKRAQGEQGPDDARATFTSSVIKRLGRATPGKQNDVGDQFSTETFLTNWSKLSPEAKTVLVSRHGPEFRRGIDALAKVADNLRQGSKVFSNPSGTSGGLASMGAAAGFGSAAVGGNLLGMATVAGGVAGANALARFVNNQAFIRAMSEATELPPQILISQITSMGQRGDDR